MTQKAKMQMSVIVLVCSICGNICILNQSEFRSSKHLKMTAWTSILWKINKQLAESWPETAGKQPSISQFYFETEYYDWALDWSMYDKLFSFLF